MGGRVVVTIVEGPLAGQRYDFTEHDVFVFGRANDCHAALTGDTYLSRHHFALEVAPPLIHARDLGSHNGTYVNGRRLGGRSSNGDLRPRETPLHNGDKIRAGLTVLEVTIDVEPAETLSPISEVPRTHTSTMSAADALKLAGYELERELGRGASSVTWLARRSRDGRPYALKLVALTSEVTSPERQRLVREAEILRRLDHPNIVRLDDSGDDGEFFHLAFEYLPDGSVGGLLDRVGKVAWTDARGIALGALEGLAYAHGQGIVHRDLKPDNVLLFLARGGWSAKIADFGLAKLFDITSSTSSVTVGGFAAGTPAYMPREQLLEFKTLRPASDVWSVAATIYRLLAGDLPRASRPGEDALQAVLESKVVPIQSRAPEVPDGVARVLDHALHADPKDRYPTAKEMLEALREVA